MVQDIFSQAIYTLEQLGVADVVLPFFLVFVLVYAILEKTNILGNNEVKSNKFNVVVAFVAGMAVVFPHVLNPGSSFDVVPIINKFLPYIALVLIAVLGFGLLYGLFTGESINSIGGTSRNIFILGALIATLIVFYQAYEPYRSGLPFWLERLLFNPALINTALALVVFGLVIWFITKDDGNVASGGGGTPP